MVVVVSVLHLVQETVVMVLPDTLLHFFSLSTYSIFLHLFVCSLVIMWFDYI